MTTAPITHIHTLPGWQIVTGPSINGRPDGGIPKIAFQQKLCIAIQGETGKYSDGVVRSPDIPIPPNTGHALLTFVFEVNDASLINAQGLEMGAKFTGENGMTQNGQIQFSYDWQTGNMTLCLTSVAGSGWTKMQVVLPKFAPGKHTVSVAYIITDEDCSVPSVAVDGQLFHMPAGSQRVVGKNLGWAKGMYQVNCQPNSNQKGGLWGWDLLDVTMAWQ